MTDIKELVTLTAAEMDDIYLRNVPANILEQYATRLIAAYLAEQEPVSLYPCGFKELKILVIKHGAYLARGMNEDEPVTESIRSSAMVLVGYAKDMSDLLAKQPLFTAPPEPAPQQQKPQTTTGDSADPAQPAAACAAPSSEEVQRMIGWLRVELGHLFTCQQAADALESLEQQVAALTEYNKTRTDELIAAGKQVAAQQAQMYADRKQALVWMDQVAVLTKELDGAKTLAIYYCEQLAAAQAREAKLRQEMLATAYDESGYLINPDLADAAELPTDDSALMERLKEEREKVAQMIMNGSFLHTEAPVAIWAREVAAAIRSMT